MHNLTPVERLGITFYPKTQHGAYYEDLSEPYGSLYVPMNADGSAGSEDEVGELAITYYEGNGEPCAARCFLCREAERERRYYEGS